MDELERLKKRAAKLRRGLERKGEWRKLCTDKAHEQFIGGFINHLDDLALAELAGLDRKILKLSQM